MAPTANHLGDMGLLPQDPQDEQVSLEDWPRKTALKTALQAVTQPDKPTSAKLWLAAEKDDSNGIRCNMRIDLVTYTAVVTAGNTDGTDKALAGQTYMCKKESAEWMKENLTHSNAEGKNLKHLKMASNLNSYSVSKYTKYVPEKVKESNDYKTLYFNKHRTGGRNPNLTMAMITAQYHSFKCSLDLYQQEGIDTHCENVHGIDSPQELKAAHKIEVDTKLTYNLHSALDIEHVGPAKRAQIIHSVYTRSVSRGVLNNTTSKNISPASGRSWRKLSTTLLEKSRT